MWLSYILTGAVRATLKFIEPGAPVNMTVETGYTGLARLSREPFRGSRGGISDVKYSERFHDLSRSTLRVLLAKVNLATRKTVRFSNCMYARPSST